MKHSPQVPVVDHLVPGGGTDFGGCGYVGEFLLTQVDQEAKVGPEAGMSYKHQDPFS